MTNQDGVQSLPDEEWRQIQGYERIYSVSNLGRVKRDRRIKIKKDGKPYPITEKLLKPYKRITNDNSGYYSVNLKQGANQKSFLVHRLVAYTFINNPDNLPCVNHKNEDKLDNRVDNFEWCDYRYSNTYNDRAKKVGQKLKGRLPSNARAVRCLETGQVYGSIEEVCRCLKMKFSKVISILSGEIELDIHLEYLDDKEIRELFKYHR